MDAIKETWAYVRIYCRLAEQLATPRIGGDWYRMDPRVTPEVAAQWASLGYYPAEARPLILTGVTPEMAAEVEAVDRGDLSPEAHAAQVLDLLVQRGLTIRQPDQQ